MIGIATCYDGSIIRDYDDGSRVVLDKDGTRYRIDKEGVKHMEVEDEYLTAQELVERLHMKNKGIVRPKPKPKESFCSKLLRYINR